MMQPLPAKILKGLKNEQFKEGETIVLKALIAGNPYPRVSFIFLHINKHEIDLLFSSIDYDFIRLLGTRTTCR